MPNTVPKNIIAVKKIMLDRGIGIGRMASSTLGKGRGGVMGTIHNIKKGTYSDTDSHSVLRDPLDEKKGYWETEELEEVITKTMFAIYDNRIHHSMHPKYMRHTHIPTKKEKELARRHGVYFPPSDMLVPCNVENPYLDVKRYGMPDHGNLFHIRKDLLEDMDEFRVRNGISAFQSPKSEYYVHGLYLKGSLCFITDKIGPGWLRRGGGYPYCMITVFAGQHGVVWYKTYITIDQNTGKATSALATLDKHKVLDQTLKADYIGYSISACGALAAYGESEYLWRVRATEGEATATFGIHEEQVKSLFYARTLPLTETGRKRPILHWVSAHRRRIKEGIDIDIKKHMRGVTEFTMLDTKFVINNPPKGEEEREARKARKLAEKERLRVNPVYLENIEDIETNEKVQDEQIIREVPIQSPSLWTKIKTIFQKFIDN